MSNRRLVVVGDALLDRDVHGTVNRLVPDAAAPVFDEAERFDRPGGAALAAALAAADGVRVTLIAAIGDDPAGTRLRRLLDEAGVHVIALGSRATRQKIRFRTPSGVVMRLDRGGTGAAVDVDDDAFAALADPAAVLVSDYGGGVTSLNQVRRAIAMLAQRRPVVWDPHPRGCDPVPGLRLVTPNESELPDDGSAERVRMAGLTRRAASARSAWRAAAVAVTLGERGALLVEGDTLPRLVPARAMSSVDSCGAGDRFAAAAAAAFADGAVVSEAVEQAVSAASHFVADGAAGSYGHRRTPRASQPSIGLHEALHVAEATRRRGEPVVATGGCFDVLHAGHIQTLQAARELGGCLIVCLNSDEGVRDLKGPGRPLNPLADRIRVLAALGCVDAVAVFNDTTPIGTLVHLRPDIWVKGGDYTAETLPEADDVAAWGGQTVILPYLPGHSTTQLIQAAAGSAADEGIS
jgi:rfaE bifunctional protein nucleotidyltransferase chain/domain/rfaE bifunctional protein kinase chain/domain